MQDYVLSDTCKLGRRFYRQLCTCDKGRNFLNHFNFSNAKKNGKKYVVDVETTFLYRNLEVTIFMTEPVGYQVITDAFKKDGIIDENFDKQISDADILELFKTIYGLVQAFRKWY